MSQKKIDLQIAKALMELIEYRAKQLSMSVVIAICTPEGNMVAVHAMDNSFLLSFQVAMKKAYTSVALKMSTLELKELTKQGATFEGLESSMPEILAIGGGIPLTADGVLLGGLGISGGTGEEDHQLAQFGLQAFQYLSSES
jgi:uncharacterized protein GlcG (DUF336 family)